MALVRRTQNDDAVTQDRGWNPLQFMGELMRWDPAQELGLAGGGRSGLSHAPAFEVKETPDAYVFSADVPGLSDDDVDITITGNQLTVAGRRSEEQRNEGEHVHLYERWYGAFTRSFALPEGVDQDNIEARLERGVLSITVPKKPEVKPRRISLKKLLRPGNKA